MRRRRRKTSSLLTTVLELSNPFFARRRRRRQKGSTGKIFWFAVVIGGIYLGAEVIRSSLGIVLAAGLFVAAIVYGRYAAKLQAEAERRWRDLGRLRSLSGEEFERHVAETYRKMGYQVELTKATADQGADIIASNDSERIAIQCKQWSGMVGNDAVQQALSGKVFYYCDRAIVVSTSDFTSAARQLAGKGDVTIINGKDYVEMVTKLVGEPLEADVMAKWLPKRKPLVTQGALFALGAGLLIAHFAIASPSSSPAPAASLVSQKAVVLASPTPPIATPTLDEAQTMVVGNTGGEGVYLRRTPHMDDKLRAWPDGTSVQILGSTLESEGLKWRKVRTPDRAEGYVPERFLLRPNVPVEQAPRPDNQPVRAPIATLLPTAPPPVTPSVPLDSPMAAVTRFYALLQQRRYNEAYSLLSSSFRSQAPYDRWVAGYNTTEAINVEYAHSGSVPNSVSVSVLATDRLPTGEVTGRFVGEWYLVLEAEAWRLDRAAIRQVP